MAIFRKNKLRGIIGPVVSKGHLEQDVLQTKPKKYKNTPDSQISACEASIASSSGKILRGLLQPLHCKFDTMVHSRMFGVLNNSIFQSKTALPGLRDLHDGDLSVITGFQLNKFSTLDKILKVRPVAELQPDGRIHLAVGKISAATDIKNPNPYCNVTVRFLCFAVNFKHEKKRYLECKDYFLPASQSLEAQQLIINCDVPPGTLLFLVCSLHWQTPVNITGGGQIINTKEYSPAEIIGVWKANSDEQTSEYPPFHNGHIENEHYRWEPLVEYKGNEQLAKAAEILQQMEIKSGKSKPENRTEERFPLNGSG